MKLQLNEQYKQPEKKIINKDIDLSKVVSYTKFSHTRGKKQYFCISFADQDFNYTRWTFTDIHVFMRVYIEVKFYLTETREEQEYKQDVIKLLK